MAATKQKILCALLLLQLLGQVDARADPAAAPVSGGTGGPVRKVIMLIEEMKAEVEKQGKDDLEAHDKYMCWCETEAKAKAEAIEAAGTKIEELGAFIQEAAATADQLTEEIKSLDTDVAASKKAVKEATELRNKEKAEFEQKSKDYKGAIELLKGAIAEINQAQLLQKKQNTQAKAKASAVAVKRHRHEDDDDDEESEDDALEARSAVATALLQVRQEIASKPGKFQNVMQRDLFDLMGSIDNYLDEPNSEASSATAFLGRSGKKVALVQGMIQHKSGVAPEAGAFDTILAHFNKDLAAIDKAEVQSDKEYQQMYKTKVSEIDLGTKDSNRKKGSYANTEADKAKAREDLKATEETKEADTKFLANMKVSCKDEDADYEVRVKARGQEIIALGETLKILTEDDNRALWGRTAAASSFVQIGSASSAAVSTRARTRAKSTAARHLAQAAMRQGSAELGFLALSTQKGAFKEALEAMDKLMAELKKQQQEETDKLDFCKKEIEKSGDDIASKQMDKSDLADKHLRLSNIVRTLEPEIEDLKKQNTEATIALKLAGEQRKKENAIFKSSFQDAVATVNILRKAKDRMEDFYASSASLIQTRAQENPPRNPGSFQKADGGGVMALLDKIIEDSKREQAELTSGEQKAQQDYEVLVKDTAASIEAKNNAQTEKTSQKSDAESERSEVENSQLATGQQLAKAQDLLKAHHLECDWLLKYFPQRSSMRSEEIDSIIDAKGILAGPGDA